MGDHWKSLAQKLGAPGMDDPTTSATDSTPPAETAFVREPEATEVVEPLAEVMTPASEHKVEEKKRKRSSWEALASMFNIQLDRTPEPTPPAEPIKPPAPAPVAPRERESRPSAEREKPRFNEPRREREAAREPERSRDSGRSRDSEPRLQVFQESTETDSNPALESLFADAPRGDLDSWKKPPRVVDDIGWDDEPQSAAQDDDAFVRETFSGSPEPTADDPVEESAEVSDRPRRRRRRRGSRRPDGGEAAAPHVERELDVAESIVPGDEYSEPESFEIDLSDSGALPTSDPERRSSRRRRRGRKRPSDEIAPSHQNDGELNAELASERPGDRPERMPDRGPRPERSSDRTSDRSPRRRGNESSGERSAARGSEPAQERSERGNDRGADRNSERGERPSRTERDAGGRREKRSESRPDRPPRVREERPLPPRSDIEELDADELDGIDSGEAGEKHRNIPSWADSLQLIIEGNMENHKRNDNRGGPPRGRPRSRR